MYVLYTAIYWYSVYTIFMFKYQNKRAECVLIFYHSLFLKSCPLCLLSIKKNTLKRKCIRYKTCFNRFDEIHLSTKAFIDILSFCFFINLLVPIDLNAISVNWLLFRWWYFGKFLFVNPFLLYNASN